MKKPNNKFALLWYSHPRIAIALMLVAINLVVIAVFTTILTVVDSGSNFFDQLAYIFTFTMSADGVYDFVNGDNTDIACFVIKIVLAIIQMVIFSGALIGFTTDLLQSAIDKRINNVGKISLSNHYVFLNWSSIGPHLIYDLSFLDGQKNVIILCEQDREEVINSIQNIFAENKTKMKNIRLFVKTGSPKSSKHLYDVSIDKAKNIGILQSCTDEGLGDMSGNDLQSLKTLFTIVNVAKNANIVVETETHLTVKKIENLLKSIDVNLYKRVIVFSHNAVLGNVLGKALINSNYVDAYTELLSYEGCEFYGIDTMDIDQALQTYNDCIPVINYDDDGNSTVDQLYVLSDKAETLGVRPTPKKMVKPINYCEDVKPEDFTVFIASNGKNSHFVISELEKANKQFCHNIKYKTYSYQDGLDQLAQDIQQTSGKKKILLLSSNSESIDSVDAEVFLTALKLKLEQVVDKDTTVYAEISNPTNVSALSNFGVMSVIVSKRIISLFMVQLMTHPCSKAFYRDLMSTNSNDETDFFDLEILPANQLIKFDGPLNFNCKSQMVQSFYHASNQKRMCLAIVKEDGTSLYLCDKMDEENKITLNPNDQLVLIKY